MKTLKILTLMMLTSIVVAAQQMRPEDLAVVNTDDGVVMVSMRMIFDDVVMRPNGMKVYQPVISDEDGNELRLPAVMLTGRRQHYVYERKKKDKRYPGAHELMRNNNTHQSFEYMETTAYADWMQGSTLTIMEDTCGCGREIGGRHEGEQYTILDNYDPLSLCQYAFVQPKGTEDPILSIKGRSYLDFPLDRTEIYADYHNNPTELHKITSSIDTVRQNKMAQIVAIRIHGYASPEGTYSHNTDLARGRAQSLKNYVTRLYDFDPTLITVRSTPEDWDGLRLWLDTGKIAHREELRNIANSNQDPDARDAQMRSRYPDEYAQLLHDVYPYLRHSDYEIDYSIRPMSIEEAKEVFRTQPALLSLGKLYQIAETYEEGSDEFNEIYDVAARLYPDDEVACLNVANIALKRRDSETARRYLTKAGNSPEAENARGVLAIIDGDYEAAVNHFKASDTEQARANLDALAPVLKRVQDNHELKHNK
ncbi:MAG: DUF3868 domain-containing protein [Paludibacteraceae bacterium]|nr:DUF3868 domain-containing protein [Paludibacteraceae bacterium]